MSDISQLPRRQKGCCRERLWSPCSCCNSCRLKTANNRGCWSHKLVPGRMLGLSSMALTWAVTFFAESMMWIFIQGRSGNCAIIIASSWSLFEAYPGGLNHHLYPHLIWRLVMFNLYSHKVSWRTYRIFLQHWKVHWYWTWSEWNYQVSLKKARQDSSLKIVYHVLFWLFFECLKFALNVCMWYMYVLYMYVIWMCIYRYTYMMTEL